MGFESLNISKPLLRALSDLGISAPTPIQERAFPTVMSGRDVVAIAQTGTGKTFAYLLPLLRMLPYSEQKQPRILIIVPTRELVVQVVDETKKLGAYMSLRIGGIYGGANINTQKQMIFNGLDILVATPGRLVDMLLDRTVHVNSIQKLVIDEVDEMLNLGFRPQLLNILDLLPRKRQNLLFSATLDEEAESIINTHFNSPQYVEVVRRGTPLEKIIQKGYHVPNFYTKVNLLEHLLGDEELKKVLVFVKTKKLADDLYKELEPVTGDAIGIIHSNKTQPQRFAAVENFGSGVHRVLIATDIISRGLDIPEVTHVINFDTPAEPGEYIHRIGRTGRADKAGTAIVFINKEERAFQKKIEALMNKKIPMAELPADVEISEELTRDEMPVTKDKNLKKFNKPVEIKGGGAFHEKKEKNKKENKGGKRFQEGLRRKRERELKKRK